jgi:DNA-binding LacI/PurR family transcriptional regulator
LKKKITIREIADACGVTIATVSRAINNKPGMREKVRKGILEHIENIGWSCNSFNTRLISSESTTKNVLILCNLQSIGGGGIDSLERALRIVIEKLEQEGITPSVFYGKTNQMLKLCLKQKPFAVLLFTSHENIKESVADLLNAGVRVVSAYSDHLSGVCPVIRNDYNNAIELTVRRLRAIGCRKIGLFAGLGGLLHPDPEKKIHSYWIRSIADFLAKYMSNFDPVKDVIGDCFGKTEGLGKILVEKKYDGWICCTRPLALSFCREGSRNGISVPEQLPMIAFGPAIDEFDPMLRVGSFSGNAEKTGELLFELALKKDFPKLEEYLIPYKWRKGTVPLRKNGTSDKD